MATIFEQIKQIELTDILDKVWVSYKKIWNKLELFDDGKETDWWRWDIVLWKITDFSGKRASWDRIEFLENYFNKDKWEVVNWLKTNFNLVDDSKPMTERKQPKREEFIKNMPCDNTVNILKRYLTFRWFPQNKIPDLTNLASELGSYEWLFIKQWEYKDTLLFPMYQNWERVWIKMRTVDGTPFSTGKSWNIKWWHTGLLYKNITDEVIIVEWEPDYLCLKALGFDSVIGNLGGIASNKDEIKKLTNKCKKVVFLYDNDIPGKNAMKNMNIGRPIYIPNFPELDGMPEYDINDLVKMGWEKSDFENLINDATLISNEKDSLFLDRILFNRIKWEFYDITDMSFVSRQKIADIYMHMNKWQKIKWTDIVAPIYDWICYLDWGRKWYYNVFDRDTLQVSSGFPMVHEELEFLIRNICCENEQNIEWLEKAILYKYTHINDSIVPAVVFHGAWWSGKWLFIKMLAWIFWEENTLVGLSQDAIESRFSHYSGKKLIVEFKEISVNSTAVGKKNMEKLKTFIMEDKMTVEKKWQDPITIENIAWFIMSSNSSRPIQFDSVDAGNRRFTIIKTGGAMGKLRWQKVRDAIDNPVNIQNYLAYLFAKYWEINNIESLENDDKTNLENLTEQESDKFFQWVEKLYPEANKISVIQRNMLLHEFYKEMGEAIPYIDNNFIRIFNTSLSTRYVCPTDKKVMINDRLSRFYSIVKNVNGLWTIPDAENKKLCKEYSFLLDNF